MPKQSPKLDVHDLVPFRFAAVVAAVVALLPSAALADMLRDALAGDTADARTILILALWAVGSITLAIRTFRFD